MKKEKLIKKWDLLAALLMMVFTIIYYFTLPVFGGMDGDFGEGAVTLFYRNYLNFCNGDISLWNTYQWTGMPALGHTVFQTVYPIYLAIFAILKNASFELFLPISYSFHMGLLVVGVYLFNRLNGISIKSSIIATMATAFSYEFIHQSGWPYLFSGFVYFPLTIDFVILFERSKGKKAWKYVLAAGIVLGLSGLANQGQTLLINILVLCILYLCYVFSRRSKAYFFRMTGKMLSFGILGCAICAPALFPALEFTLNCSRYVPEMGFIDAGTNLTLEAFTTHATTLSSFGTFLQFPTVYTENSGAYTCGSVAVIVSICAVIGLFSRVKDNKVENIFSKILAIFCICYACNFVISYVFYYLPGYNAVREPYLYIPYLVLPLTYLTGLGLDTILGARSSIQELIESLHFPVICFILIGVCCLGIFIPYNFQSKNVLILIFILLIFLCPKIIKKDNVMRLVLAALLLMCICIQMYINCGEVWGFTYKDVYAKVERQIENVEVAESILPEESNRYDRFFGFGASAWSSNTMSLVGNNDALGYINPIPRTGYLLYSTSWRNQAILRNMKYWYTTTDHEDYYHQILEEISSYLGTIQTYPSYDSTELQEFDVYKADTMGIAWVVNDITYVDDVKNMSSDDVLALLSDEEMDYRTAAYVSKEINVDAGDNDWSVTNIIYKDDEIIMKVNSEKAALLVTAEVWYPGWKVYIDGEEADVLQVNCCNRGCAITAGDHTVSFVYKPMTAYIGLALCIFCILIWITVYIFILFNEKEYAKENGNMDIQKK